MTVTADSYEAKVSEATVAMVAGSSTFRTLVAAADAAEAKGFIVEDVAGRANKASNGGALNIAGHYAIVAAGPLESELRAVNTYGRSGTVEVLLHFLVTAAEDPDDQFRAARNAQGLLKADMEALFGTANTYLTAGTIQSGQIELAEGTGANRLHLLCPLNISWRDVP
jgi:hypothetical protein